MHRLSPQSFPSLHAPLLGQHLAFALQRTSETLLARTLGGDDQRLVDQVTLGVAAAEQLRLIADAPQPIDAARMVALDEGFDRLDSRSADQGGEACVVASAPAGPPLCVVQQVEQVVAAGAPYVQDAVLTGINGREVGALIFATQAVRELSGLGPDATLQQVLESAPVQARFQRVLDELARAATGSANRIARLHLVAEPPALDRGEVTDKGSINQRAVLKHRAALVEAFHADALPFTLKPQGEPA